MKLTPAMVYLASYLRFIAIILNLVSRLTTCSMVFKDTQIYAIQKLGLRQGSTVRATLPTTLPVS